jgi:hypothetical protein
MMSGVALDYCLTSSSALSATVTAGGTAEFPMAAQAQGFSGAVALTCVATIPQGVCSVTPASVMLAGGNPGTPLSFQVSVTTTAGLASTSVMGAPVVAGMLRSGLLRFAECAFGVLIAWGLIGRGRASRLNIQGLHVRAFRLAQAGVILAALALGLVGCFGGQGAAVQPMPGTPAGTYSLTVTGTAAGATRTINLTLTVQ